MVEHAGQSKYPRVASRRHQHVPPSSGTRSAEAAKRKRERDRECQRRKRQRERQHTEQLEKKIRDLQAQLETFQLQKNADLDQIATYPTEECIAGLTPSSQCHSVSVAPSDGWHEGHRRAQSVTSSVQQPLSPVNSRDSSSDTVTVSLGILESCLAAPQWARLPLHGLSLVPNPRHCVRGNGLGIFISLMRADPSMEELCSPTPKVIDILYGGSKNPLANLIVNECSKEALLAPEKLAVNFALYKYCRWLIWPSQESFACLPKYIHPTAMQLTVEHQWCIDMVVWSEIRENMIRNQSSIDMDAAIGLLLCSSRIRGSFNTNFISRHDEGDLEIDREFYSRFTDPENWGLLETFWTAYPYLVEGLDPRVKIREQDLLAS